MVSTRSSQSSPHLATHNTNDNPFDYLLLAPQWLPEEMKYASVVMDHFSAGVLELPKHMTLR